MKKDMRNLEFFHTLSQIVCFYKIIQLKFNTYNVNGDEFCFPFCTEVLLFDTHSGYHNFQHPDDVYCIVSINVNQKNFRKPLLGLFLQLIGNFLTFEFIKSDNQQLTVFFLTTDSKKNTGYNQHLRPQDMSLFFLKKTEFEFTKAAWVNILISIFEEYVKSQSQPIQ